MGTARELGRGVAIGLVATAAFTATRPLKRRLGGGTVRPADAVPSLAGAGHAAAHWGYGAWGGVLRVLLARLGLSGARLDAAQLALFWLPWRVLALASGTGSGGPRALLVDLGRHGVYVLAGRVAEDVGRHTVTPARSPARRG